MSDFRGRARSVRIAMAQLDGAPGDVEANLSQARQIVAEARAAGANLVVFPELFLTGYVPSPGCGNLAIAADDVRLTMLANGGPERPGAIVGFQEAARLGLLHNSAVYLQAGKACHVHRKVSVVSCHLFQEGRRFSTGSAIRALDTPWGRMEILIRNDAWQAGSAWSPSTTVPGFWSSGPTVPAASPQGRRSSGPCEDHHPLPRHAAGVLRSLREPGRHRGQGRLLGRVPRPGPRGRGVAAAPLYTGELVMAAVDLAGVACRRREMPLLENPRLDFLLQELSRLTTNREEAGVQRSPPRARAPEYQMSATHVVPWPASGRRFRPRRLLHDAAAHRPQDTDPVTRRLAGRTRTLTPVVMKHRKHIRPRTAAALALAAAALLAGCGSGGNFSPKNFAPSTAVVSFPAGQPGTGKPAVTLGTKNFTEEFILGQLYAQALKAKGFTVHLIQNIGPTEVIDPGLLNGQIDLYPEYTGEIVSTLTNIALGAPGGAADRAAPPPPQSWQQAYEQAASFEDRRGFTLLQPTPFQDTDELIVLKTFAAKHHLTTTEQLKGLGPLKLGAYPPEQTRYEGYVGLQQAYGLNNLQFVPLAAEGPIYAALDSGQVQVGGAFSTDPQLLSGKYAVLSDPKNIFGYQNVAPVVSKAVLKREGPAFAQTLNAVSSRLTTAAMRHINAEVVLGHRSPAAVARQFLATELST